MCDKKKRRAVGTPTKQSIAIGVFGIKPWNACTIYDLSLAWITAFCIESQIATLTYFDAAQLNTCGFATSSQKPKANVSLTLRQTDTTARGFRATFHLR